MIDAHEQIDAARPPLDCPFPGSVIGGVKPASRIMLEDSLQEFLGETIGVALDAIRFSWLL